MLCVHYIGIRNLLSRCVDSFNKKNNESCNQSLWKINPKNLNSKSTIVEIAVYVATCVFNKGALVLLMVVNAHGINCRSNGHR